MSFDNAENPADFVEAVRNMISGCVPGADAWKEPNFFSVISNVIGGASWTAINEARRGVDARCDPRFMSGDALDAYAAIPPCNLRRLDATCGTGIVLIKNTTLSPIPAGYIITSSCGAEFTVDMDTPVTNGEALVMVTSSGKGSESNSPENQILSVDDGEAISRGVYGAFDRECDDDFRRRIFAQEKTCFFFGSACSLVDQVEAFQGVTRAWAYVDGAVASIAFLMEDKYPCGVPLQEDIDALFEMFEDECLSPMCFCPNFKAACSLTLAPEIEWKSNPDICEVQEAIQAWLRENYGLGEGVKACDLRDFLNAEYGEFGPSLDCCEDYEGQPCCVYNCVELLGCS